MKEVVKDFLL
jgi:hypothetical protein